MAEKAIEATPVSDRVTDRWIKVVAGLVTLTATLMSYIGYEFISEQKQTNASLVKIQDKMNEKFTIYEVMFEKHSGKITRIEEDVKEVRDVQINYGKRIIRLERRR